MATVYYSPTISYCNTLDEMKCSALWDLLYDVEQVQYPHLKANGGISECPALKVAQNMTYIVKSPIDLSISFNQRTNKIEVEKLSPETIPKVAFFSVESIRSLPHIYFQTLFNYVFWTDSKDVQLWMHDIPEVLNTKEKNYYIAPGMIPIGKYVRMINEPIVMKTSDDDVKKFKISRGEPVMGITFFSKDKIKLVRKEPTRSVLQEALRNGDKKNFCPYTFSRDLFKKWLTKGD